MRALFLRVPASPGAVYGLLQRRWGRERLDRLDLLLSGPASPEGWRALAGGEAEGVGEWMEEAGPILAGAFPPAVTMLWAGAAAWGFCVWPGGERGGGTKEPARRGGWLSRLLPPAAPPAPELEWAGSRGLPVELIAALEDRPPRPTIVDWATVAGLVERGLLVESGPRFYRLRFA